MTMPRILVKFKRGGEELLDEFGKGELILSNPKVVTVKHSSCGFYNYLRDEVIAVFVDGVRLVDLGGANA